MDQALLPTAYLPSIAYMTVFLRYERVVLEQHEHYQKGGLRNRCFIATANGAHRLTIPLLKGKHQQLPVREVRIDYREPWIRNHWQSLTTAYGSAPFFEEYASALRPVFDHKPAFLFDLNLELLHTILGFLSIKPRPGLSSEYAGQPDFGIDLRQAFAVKNAPEAALLHFIPASYPQVFSEKHGFLPNLSILDLLFCLGPEAFFILKKSAGL